MSKLEYLQRLSGEEKNEELQIAIMQCSCKELRSFIGLLGIRVRSKDYAIYTNKAGYADLLFQILTGKAEHKEQLLPTKTRKTKKCTLRLVNVIFGEGLANVVDEMNAEAAQTALDSDQVAPQNPFWEKVRVEFVSFTAKYGRVKFTDKCFGGYELGTPVPHSSEKLWKMWRELCAAYTSAADRFEHTCSGGPDSEFVTFCRNRMDVYYLRRWLTVKPHLLASVNGKLSGEGQSTISSVVQSERFVGQESVAGISRKRKNDVVGHQFEIAASVANDAMVGRGKQRAELMKSIKQACETLKAVREAEVGWDVEEIVQDELTFYAKRLKSIQEEDAVLRHAQDPAGVDTHPLELERKINA